MNPAHKVTIMSVSFLTFLFYEGVRQVAPLPLDKMIYTGPDLLTLAVGAFYLIAMYAVVHGGDGE